MRLEGVWGIADGIWSMVKAEGVLKVEYRNCNRVDGYSLWTIDHRLWTMVYGLWSIVKKEAVSEF